MPYEWHKTKQADEFLRRTDAERETFNLLLDHAAELDAYAVLGVRYDATVIIGGISD